MGKGKVQVFFVAVKDQGDRLIRGTLRDVESKLRGETDIHPATAEEAHKMHAVEIEDATGEP